MKTYFAIGDRVKFWKGGLGTVISLSKKPEPKGTEQKILCCVEWDDNGSKGNPGNNGGMIPGRNISISLPSQIKNNYIISPAE